MARLRYKIASGTPASNATEMPPLRADTPEKRTESPPACLTGQRIQSLACCREHGRSVATVTPPRAHLVSGSNRGHPWQRAAGRVLFAQSACTANRRLGPRAPR